MRLRRTVTGVLAVVLSTAALVLVLVAVSRSAITEGSREVGRQGTIAIMAEATLSAASSVQNAASQVTVLERGRVAGWVEASDVVNTAGQLATLSAEFQRRAGLLATELEPSETDHLRTAASAFSAQADILAATLRAPDLGEIVRVEAIDPSLYASVAADLVTIRDTRVNGSLATAVNAGQVADAVRFLIIVVIPMGAMLVFRRVFRRRREREELRAEIAHQKALMGQKDEFVANLSHELKTPLTGIYGFALALDESGFEDPELASELNGHVIAEAGELARMVDDLITAGQIETGGLAFEIEHVDIDAAIDAVVGPYLRSGVDIAVATSGHAADADPRHLEQILRTLIANAVKHGGDTIEVFSEYGPSMVSVFVMDNGDGVPEETVDRIFDRYVHEGSEPLLQGSLGIGLSVARALAVGMGGDLTYTRTNGITYFVLKLPSRRVAKLQERVEDSGRAPVEGMYDTQQVAKLFSRS